MSPDNVEPKKKSKPIRSLADMFDSFDLTDELIDDPSIDPKRISLRIGNSKLRVDLIKVAVKAGAVKPSALALPEGPPDMQGDSQSKPVNGKDEHA